MPRPFAPIDQVQFDVVPALVGVDYGAKGDVDRPLEGGQRFGPLRRAEGHRPQARAVLREPQGKVPSAGADRLGRTVQRRPRREEQGPGVLLPERRQPLNLVDGLRGEGIKGNSASIQRSATRCCWLISAAATSQKAVRKASIFSSSIFSPAAAAWPPWVRRHSSQVSRAACRLKPGMLRAEPMPGRVPIESKAMSTTGR